MRRRGSRGGRGCSGSSGWRSRRARPGCWRGWYYRCCDAGAAQRLDERTNGAFTHAGVAVQFVTPISCRTECGEEPNAGAAVFAVELRIGLRYLSTAAADGHGLVGCIMLHRNTKPLQAVDHDFRVLAGEHPSQMALSRSQCRNNQGTVGQALRSRWPDFARDRTTNRQNAIRTGTRQETT